MPTNVEYSRDRGTIYTILNSDGKFHTQVSEGTEGSVKRDWETKDGKKGSKWERVAEAITGKITGISIYEGDYGKQIQLTLGENEITIFLSTQSPFGEDFMKKLPNINLEQDVRLAPFAFEDDNKKNRKGLTIYQGPDNKIQDYYHKKNGEKVEAVNGYPIIPEDAKNWDSDAWKLYFLGARQFLIGELKKSPLFNKTTQEGINVQGSSIPYPNEEINPSDIPF